MLVHAPPPPPPPPPPGLSLAGGGRPPSRRKLGGGSGGSSGRRLQQFEEQVEVKMDSPNADVGDMAIGSVLSRSMSSSMKVP